MKNPRLYPKIWDACYIHLSDLKESIERVAPDIRGDVVDYGAGTKPYKELFTNVSSYRGADFIIYDAQDIKLDRPDYLPLPDESVDHVVSFQVLEHVEFPQQHLRECRRVLKSGGHVLLTTHGTWCYHGNSDCGDFWRWTQDGLEKVFQESGFVVDSVEGLSQGSRCWLQLLLILWEPHHFDNRNIFIKIVSRLLFLAVNVFAVVIHPLLKSLDAQMEIIPIAYLVRAHKI